MGVSDNLKPDYKITKPSFYIYNEGRGFIQGPYYVEELPY